MNNHFPHDLTLDCRRLHARRRFYRELSWLCLSTAFAVLCVALGVLIATINSACLSFLAGLAILAGLKAAHYLLTRH